MKKFFVKFAMWTAVVLLHAVVVAAQGQGVISFGIGGPSTYVVIANNATDGTAFIVESAGKLEVLRNRGDRFRVRIGPFSMYQGESPILVTACDATMTGYHFNSAPLWAADVVAFPGNAITDDFLRTHPSKEQVEGRVKAINHILHGQLGGKQKGNELKEWFDNVKHEGVSGERVECGHPMPLDMRSFNWAGLYYGYNQTVMVSVNGSRDTRYTLSSAPFVR